MASHSKRAKDKAKRVLLPNDVRLAMVDKLFAADNADVYHKQMQSNMRAVPALVRSDYQGTYIPDNVAELPQSRKPRDKRTAFNAAPTIKHSGGFTSRKVN